LTRVVRGVHSRFTSIANRQALKDRAHEAKLLLSVSLLAQEVLIRKVKASLLLLTLSATSALEKLSRLNIPRPCLLL
jgi:hypothetical protein